MEPCSRVRVAKCQMLATSLFVLLLGSAMAATAALSYFGPHFTVIGPVSADRTTYEALHHWAFSAGIALAALLTLGAMLSAAATVRGAGGLMAAAFLSFALVFCALVQAAFWRAHSPTQINRSRWTQARPSSHHGGRRAGRLRPGLRAGAEERIRKRAAGAGGHPGHVPVLWQELAPWAPGGLGSRPVSGGGGCQTGLPAGDPELPEGAQEHRLHPDRPGPRLHGPATTLPRSPESTDASGRDPRLRARPKQMLLGAV
ncbi:tetraspanin-32 isoform X7 [Bos indicus]|uniref:Tetraspanin-32 isoform X7 n=1 Tax=Bos indicus TaxID=9915 RepID=A0ABM4RSY2_BOSIN